MTHLAGLDLDWLILRPALVLSPAAYGGTAMLRAIAACPLVTPVVAADARIQVVSVADVARTVAFALKPGAPARAIWQLAHPHVHRLEDIVLAHARLARAGRRGRSGACRTGVARAVAACADALSWLGWRSPARSTALRQLTRRRGRRSGGLDRGDRHRAAKSRPRFSPNGRRTCRTAGTRGFF